MSFAPRELARLLARPTATTGVIVAIDGDTVRVATRSGAVTALPGSGQLTVGDRVTLTDGRAVRTQSAARRYAV